MRLRDRLYAIVTIPIYFLGFIIGLLGVLLTGLGDVLMSVWETDWQG